VGTDSFVKYLLALSLLYLGGCATLQDPNVWAPVVAAALLQVNDADEEISDYLLEETPVFGSVENAKDWSDNFRSYTSVAYAGTALSIDRPVDHRVLLLMGEWVSVGAVDNIRGRMQESIARDRPDGSGPTSMPSGHTTTASYQASLARTNIGYLDVSSETKQRLSVTVTTFSVLSGYARIEAGRHYPSDVLVGYALGSFFGGLATYAIDRGLTMTPLLSRDRAGVVVAFDLHS
jgi:hypothetical protein